MTGDGEGDADAGGEVEDGDSHGNKKPGLAPNGKRKERKMSKDEFVHAAEPPPLRTTSKASVASAIYNAPYEQKDDAAVIAK